MSTSAKSPESVNSLSSGKSLQSLNSSRPQLKYFYYAYARFADYLDARKLTEEIKYPEIHGKICRALPFDKEMHRGGQQNCNIFVKGFGKHWTHKDLHETF